MREKRREPRPLPRPEGVGLDWLTKNQAMQAADIRSDRTFRILSEEAREELPEGMHEEGPARPTWVSPAFLAVLIELNSIPPAEPTMHAAKEAAKIIPCGYSTFLQLVDAHPPDPKKPEEMVAKRRAGNGAPVLHYSGAYIDALAQIHQQEREAREELATSASNTAGVRAARQKRHVETIKAARVQQVGRAEALQAPELPIEKRQQLLAEIQRILPLFSDVIATAPVAEKPEMNRVRQKLLLLEAQLLQHGRINPDDVQEFLDEAQFYIDEA